MKELSGSGITGLVEARQDVPKAKTHPPLPLGRYLTPPSTRLGNPWVLGLRIAAYTAVLCT